MALIREQYVFGTATVLGATYLYSAAEGESARKLRPPPISVSDYEKSEELSYFDLESVANPAKSPMHGGAISSSRPSTPASERRPLRMKSSENLRSKRAQ
jgi:UDP-sugar transporter A1/2/3